MIYRTVEMKIDSRSFISDKTQPGREITDKLALQAKDMVAELTKCAAYVLDCLSKH